MSGCVAFLHHALQETAAPTGALLEVVGEARGVAEEVAEGDLLGAVDASEPVEALRQLPRKVRGDGIAEADLTALVQLHHHRGDVKLGDAGDEEGRVGSDGGPARPGLPHRSGPAEAVPALDPDNRVGHPFPSGQAGHRLIQALRESIGVLHRLHPSVARSGTVPGDKAGQDLLLEQLLIRIRVRLGRPAVPDAPDHPPIPPLRSRCCIPASPHGSRSRSRSLYSSRSSSPRAYRLARISTARSRPDPCGRGPEERATSQTHRTTPATTTSRPTRGHRNHPPHPWSSWVARSVVSATMLFTSPPRPA